jgi:hypothetical protein
MTRKDLPHFTAQLLILAEGFGASMSKARFAYYRIGLKDLKLELVIYGLEQAIRRCKFFPSVAEIRELIEGTVEEAEDAWLQLQEVIRDKGSHYPIQHYPIQCEDLAVAEAIRMLYGDWPDACTAILQAEGPEKAMQRRNFLRAYRIGRRRALVEADGRLKGLREIRAERNPNEQQVQLPVMVISRVERPHFLGSGSLGPTPPRDEHVAYEPAADRMERTRLPRWNGDQTPGSRGASATHNGH